MGIIQHPWSTRRLTSYTMGQLAISEICNHYPLQQTLKVISCINFRGGLTACLNKLTQHE